MKRRIIENNDITNRVGVTTCRECQDWIYDEIHEGIDIGYESFIAELKSEGKTDEEIEDECYEYQADTTEILFGDWKTDKDGKYEPDKNGPNGFSAMFQSGSFGDIIIVEWSKFAAYCHRTSPCFVMADGSGPCGDLDTDGDLLAYSLPADFYRGNESE